MTDGSDVRSSGVPMQGERMRELRQRLRLTQGALKDALNQRLGRSYDKPRVSRWENSREPIPEDVSAELELMVEHRPHDARIVVLANQKGGVGKTTSAINLACALAASGRRVLLVDMDPQATATVGLLAERALEAYRQGRTTAHVLLHGQDLQGAIVAAAAATPQVPFDILPSHIDLAEVDGRREPGFDVILREKLDEVRAGYDFIVIDAPPNLGMLTWMTLTAAQEVIVPVRTEPYDTMGVGLILGTVNKVQRRLNPALRLAGILPTQYNRRKSVDREVLHHLILAMGEKGAVLEPVPESAVFGHAARNGAIAFEATPSAPAVLVYGRLAQAMIEGRPLPAARLGVTTAEQEATHGQA